MRTGRKLQDAFGLAVQQIGQAELLMSQFAQAGGASRGWGRQFILTLMGIPNPQFATNMNTSAPNHNIEPAWATYFRAVTFMIPAVFLWLFATVFLLPKLNAICQAAGTTVFNFGDAPGLFRAFASIGQATIFLTHHSLLIAGTVAVVLILLEWRFGNWPRYRRMITGLGAFLLNAIVLISITMMVLSAVLAALAVEPNIR
jgi:hypothetical protein